MRRLILLILALVAAQLPQTAASAQQPATAAVAFADRAAQLPAVLEGKLPFTDFFTAEFLAAIPPAQLSAVTASLLAQHGAPQGVERIDAVDDVRGTVHIRFAKAIGQFQMTIDPAQGGRVAGLLVAAFSSPDDSSAKVMSEIRALPGVTSLQVARIDGAAPVDLISHNPDQALAIGSTFKLYILAELARRIARDEMRWNDVTTLSRRSFSSKGTEHWPADAPVTLHSLAAWMVSVSDNSATDVLLALLGRDAVGKQMTVIGNSAAARNLPFLNTVEAFALKAETNAALRARFLAANEAEQRRIVDAAADQLTLNVVEGAMFVGKPLYIDSIEWFASSRDLVRLLDHLRTADSADARAIMAINPGISRDAAARWSYIGYKGGSESGVISMSFLLQSKACRWYAVTGSWNDVNAPVDNGKFTALMQRLVDQVAKDDAAIS